MGGLRISTLLPARPAEIRPLSRAAPSRGRGLDGDRLRGRGVYDVIDAILVADFSTSSSELSVKMWHA